VLVLTPVPSLVGGGLNIDAYQYHSLLF